MDSLGLFILLMLLCFQWTIAPAAGKVLVNMLISVMWDLFCFDISAADYLGFSVWAVIGFE